MGQTLIRTKIRAIISRSVLFSPFSPRSKGNLSLDGQLLFNWDLRANEHKERKEIIRNYYLYLFQGNWEDVSRPGSYGMLFVEI